MLGKYDKIHHHSLQELDTTNFMNQKKFHADNRRYIKCFFPYHNTADIFQSTEKLTFQQRVHNKKQS